MHGKDFAEAKAHAHEIADEKSLAYIDGYDDRAFATSDVSTVNVLCTVETRNHQHLAELRAQLKSYGVETYDSK